MVGVQQFVDDIGKVRGKRLSDLRAGILRGDDPADIDQPDQRLMVPGGEVVGMLGPQRGELVMGVIDQCCELGAFLLRNGIGVEQVDLFPDHPRCIVEDMGDRLIFSMQVADKVLGSLG